MNTCSGLHLDILLREGGGQKLSIENPWGVIIQVSKEGQNPAKGGANASFHPPPQKDEVLLL